MKRLITILIIPLFIFMLISTVSAHKGRTDAQGGHYNRTTGEYHYHHGYPEHQHFNGECPYQDEEKEKQEILEKKRENYYEKEEKKNSPFAKIIGVILGSAFFGWALACIPTAVITLPFIWFTGTKKDPSKISEIVFKCCIIVFTIIITGVLLYNWIPLALK